MNILVILKKRRETDLSDWERVRSMTNEEIEKNALSDPDALPFDDEWEDADVIYPTQKDLSVAHTLIQ